MKIGLLCGMVTASISIVLCGTMSTQDADRKSQIWTTSSPAELEDAVDSYLGHLSLQDRDKLVDSPDLSTSLVGAWDRATRKLRAPGGQDRYSRESILNWFVGFVEGRTGFGAPEFWISAVYSANIQNNNIVFSIDKNSQRREKDSESKVVLPRRMEDKWVVLCGLEEWTIPATDNLGPVDSAVVLSTPDDVYLAVYGWPAHSYELYAISRTDKSMRWHSAVWANGGLSGAQGRGRHVAEIRCVRGQLAVFGISSEGAYVELFDSAMGSNAGRFSTRYVKRTE